MNPFHWLRTQLACSNTRRRALKWPRAWERCRLQLERLEDRLAPTIDIFAGAAGTQPDDSTFLAANGVIASPAASLSTGALQAIGQTSNISITATDGDIVFHANLGTVNLAQTTGIDVFAANLGAITVTTPTDRLTTAGAGFAFTASTSIDMGSLQAGAGNNAKGSILLGAATGAITQTGILSGFDITISSSGDVCLGGLAASGTISVTSTNGAILDCNDPPTGTPNFTAPNLALSASTGIGVPSVSHGISAGDAPIETAVGHLVARTVTGGIFIGNAGPVTIGYAGDPFQSVQNVGATGDIVLNATGTISITTSFENIQGPANVTVNATGATSDIRTGGSQQAIQNVGGGLVKVTAGRDIVIGDPVFGFGNINANFAGNAAPASVFLNALRDITLQGKGAPSFLDANNGGSVTAIAGRDIAVGADGSGSSILDFRGASSPITVTTGAGGVLTVGPGAAITSANNSTGARVVLSADDMYIDPSAAISAGTSNVILQTVTPTEVIDLGTTANPTGNGTLGLSDAELSRVTAQILEIGGDSKTPPPSNTGGIQVTAPITVHAHYNTLALLTQGTITEPNLDSTVAVANLYARGDAGVNMFNAGNSVNNLAGSTVHAAFFFQNAGDLIIGTVDGVNGIDTNSILPFSAFEATAAAIAAGGSEYLVGDLLTLSGGTFVTAAQLQVTSVDATGAITGATIVHGGSYSVPPPNPVSVTEGSGSGNGAAFTLTFSGIDSGAISVATNAGSLSVNQHVSAGAATIDLTAGGSNQLLTSKAAVSNSGGQSITVIADRMAIAAGSITADNGGDVILEPHTSGQPINLGPPTDPIGSLNLSNAELNTVTAGALVIGNGSAGNVVISSSIAITRAPTVVIDTAGTIKNNPITATLTATFLDLQAGNTVSLLGANSVSRALAAVVLNAGQGFTFNYTGALDVNNAGGINGITTNGGLIGLLLTGPNNLLTISQPVDSTFGGGVPAGANITLSADNMAIKNLVNAGTAIVTLKSTSAAARINLGGNDASGTLGLSSAELDLVAAGILRVGSAMAGTITVSDTIDLAAQIPILSLITGGGINETSGEGGTGTLDVPHLRISAAGDVTMPRNNRVDMLAASTSNHNFVFTNAETLTLGSVDAQNGINIGTGAVGLRSAGAILNVLPSGNAVTARSVGLNAGGGIGTALKPLTLAPCALSAVTASNAMFLFVSGTATLNGNGLNAGANAVYLTGGTFALSANNQIAAASSLCLTGAATLNLGAFSATVAALTLSSTTTVRILINAFSAGNFGNLSVQGAINLGNATLQLTLGAGFTLPTTSASIFLIRRLGNSPITGRFGGLSNNTTFMVGAFSFRIIYT